MAKRVVLAYSGGLDTSVAVKWLQLERGVEVIACAVDVGQEGGDLETVRQRALDTGAVESVVIDAREEFADDFLVPALKANALYEGRYPLVSALSRPVIVKHLVQTARYHGADEWPPAPARRAWSPAQVVSMFVTLTRSCIGRTRMAMARRTSGRCCSQGVALVTRISW